MKTAGSVLLALLMLQPASAGAQAQHASIRGQVLDGQGAAHADVRVAAHNEETGETRRASAGPGGEFTLPALGQGQNRDDRLSRQDQKDVKLSPV